MGSEISLECSPSQSMIAGLSRDIVGIYARLLGRGPTRARSYLHEDYGLCVLKNIFTKSEQTLIAAGMAERALETRRSLQEAIDSELIRVVEERTGRRVRACLGQVDVNADLAIEYFLFERADGGDEQR